RASHPGRQRRHPDQAVRRPKPEVCMATDEPKSDAFRERYRLMAEILLTAGKRLQAAAAIPDSAAAQEEAAEVLMGIILFVDEIAPRSRGTGSQVQVALANEGVQFATDGILGVR